MTPRARFLIDSNFCLFSGRFREDPVLERRDSPYEKAAPFCFFYLGCNDHPMSTQKVMFIPMFAWGTLAERVCSTLKKGYRIHVEARLHIPAATALKERPELYPEPMMFQLLKYSLMALPGDANADSLLSGAADDALHWTPSSVSDSS